METEKSSILKQMEAVSGGATQHSSVVLPARVIFTPVEAPMHHPLSKSDIQRIISSLPESSTKGLRSVSLLPDMWTDSGSPVVSSYRTNGFIRLHAVSSKPWIVDKLSSTTTVELLRYGAIIEAGKNENKITWSTDALRLFITIGAFLPGLLRHKNELSGQHQTNHIVRSLENELPRWNVSDNALNQWKYFLGRTA
jgi:hypothetical protein